MIKLLIGVGPDAVLADASSSIDVNAAVEALTFKVKKWVKNLGVSVKDSAIPQFRSRTIS